MKTMITHTTNIDMNRNKLNSNNLANDGALKIVEKRLSKLRLLLIRLRQICCAIYDQEHKKEWRDIMEDIDSVLCRGDNSKYSSDESVFENTEVYTKVKE